MYSRLAFLIAGQLLAMIISLDCPCLRDLRASLCPEETRAKVKQCRCDYGFLLLTDSVLSRSNGELDLLVHVVKSVGLLSHVAIASLQASKDKFMGPDNVSETKHECRIVSCKQANNRTGLQLTFLLINNKSPTPTV